MRRRPVFVIVTAHYPPQTGGLARLAADVRGSARRLGLRCLVLASGETVPRRYGVLRLTRSPGADRVLRAFPALARLARSLRVWWALRRIRRRVGLDLVEFSNWDLSGFAHGLLKLAPMLTRLSTSPLQAESPIPGGGLAAMRARLLRAAVWAMERAMVIRSDAILSNSKAHRDEMVALLRLPPAVRARITLVPLTTRVPNEAAAPAIAAPFPTLLFVGRATPRKGFDLLVAAAARLTDLSWRLTVVGMDRTTTESLLRSAGCPVEDGAAVLARSRFLTGLDEAALDETYRNADVFVLPSRYESFGLVTVEAMSHALPVAAFAVGGTLDIVVHGETGLLAWPDDVVTFADHLRTLIGSSALRHELGANGRARQRERFGPAGFDAANASVFDQVICRCRA